MSCKRSGSIYAGGRATQGAVAEGIVWTAGRNRPESGAGEGGYFDDEDSMEQDFGVMAGAWLHVTSEFGVDPLGKGLLYFLYSW